MMAVECRTAWSSSGEPHGQFSVPKIVSRFGVYGVPICAGSTGQTERRTKASLAPVIACDALLWRDPWHGAASREHGYSEFYGRPEHGLGAGPPDRRRLFAASERAWPCDVTERPPLCPQRYRSATHVPHR